MKCTLVNSGIHRPLGGGLWSKYMTHEWQAGRMPLPWGLLAALLIADALVWRHIPPGALVVIWAGLSLSVVSGGGCVQGWFKTLGFRDGVSRHSFKTSNTKVPL